MPRIAQHEAVQTLNYLFQSASYLSAVAGAPPSLAISRARQLVGLSKKATTRLDTSVKRSICRRCRAPLVLEGLTSCVRVKRSGPHGWVKVTRCLACTRTQIVPLGPGFDEESRRQKALKKREKRRAKAAEKRRRMAEAGEKNAQQETSRKRPISQRARRRASREKRATLEAMNEVNDRSALKKSIGPRRRSKRCDKDEVKQMGQDKDADIEMEPRDVPATSSSEAKRSRRRRKKALVAPSLDSPSIKDQASSVRLADALPRYTDRLRDSADWHRAVEKASEAGQLDQEQQSTLQLLRGDHIMAHGIGRGGVLGPS
ncbi:hypothetical protein FA10DRAFT_263621 [Acaromyces ingoldii]|uniref:Rpr2-domain-containing protein n=1 Tax=Acaromyces ingoldii TaxID=215250 RepID=A0A316YTI4_9BASI|nr:hypothetical protein FA10DRAFT_263621 [Acaromyces ingoldii]PWN92880.1 hypothetical protein FA10DRAFT_263621 [Acaromyces ingoldii]